MFSCNACKHGKYPSYIKDFAWTTCNHPAIKKIGLVEKESTKITKDDWLKFEHLVTDILKLRIIYLGHKIPNFEFPFHYDALWITGCDKFEKK